MLRVVIGCVVLSLSYAVMAETQILKTQGFMIELSMLCEEGEVVCDKVLYKGTSLKTGHSIKLMGKTEHLKCADGNTPCRFLGYTFTNSRVIYTVSASGLLSVIQDGNILLQQQGQWQ